MKNTIKWFGIIALVAIAGMSIVVTSCTNVGGSLTVKNGSDKRIEYFIEYNGLPSDNGSLEAGASKTYDYTEDRDGTVKATAVYPEGGSIPGIKGFSERFTVKNDDITVTVTFD